MASEAPQIRSPTNDSHGFVFRRILLASRDGGCHLSSHGPLLDIVIVNWNSGDQLRACLDSINSSSIVSFRLGNVVVVDNASSDGSLSNVVGQRLPLAVHRNPQNVGFAAACNIGAAGCESEYILFLNPDTVLREESLATAIAFMEKVENSRVGICGIQLTDDQGVVQRTCARLPTPSTLMAASTGFERIAGDGMQPFMMTEWDHGTSRDVDHVTGAFFLVRSRVWQELSGFDERFFMYLEDLDFSLRATTAGWGSHFLAETSAYHRGGGTSYQVPAKRIFYSQTSHILYGFKHFDRRSAAAIALSAFLVEPIARLAMAAVRRSWSRVERMGRAYALLWRSVPTLVRTIRCGRTSVSHQRFLGNATAAVQGGAVESSRGQLSVVIVTYNSEADISLCLASIRRFSPAGTVIVAVDNASGDRTVETIRRTDPAVVVIESPTNSGFGAACNVGVGVTATPLVLLLNPDAVLQSPLVPGVGQFEVDQHLGVLGGVERDESGKVRSAAGRNPSPVRLLARRTMRYRSRSAGDVILSVDWVEGCFLMTRRDLWMELEGMDEGFFMYGEDVDFSARARNVGFRTAVDSRLVFEHVGGYSSDRTDWVVDGLLRYHRKHSTAAVRGVARLALLPGLSARFVEASIKRDKKSEGARKSVARALRLVAGR